MLKIRLQRIGKRGQAHFRLVVTEHTAKPQGKYLELLGSYNPHTKELKARAERIKHWLSHGAQPSATLNNLLISKEVVSGQKVKTWRPKKKKAGSAASAQVSPLVAEPAQTESNDQPSVDQKQEDTPASTEGN